MVYASALEDLIALLLPDHASFALVSPAVRFLTRFAVGTRYPGENATKRQAAAAFRWAGRVRQEARTLLGRRPRPRGRRKSP